MKTGYLQGDLAIGLGRSYATETKYREPYLKFYREHIFVAEIYYHSVAKTYVMATAEDVALTKATLKELMGFMNIKQFRLCRRWAQSRIKIAIKELKNQVKAETPPPIKDGESA